MQEPTDLVVSGSYLNKTLERDVDPISLIDEPFEASVRGSCSTERSLPIHGVTGLAIYPFLI